MSTPFAAARRRYPDQLQEEWSLDFRQPRREMTGITEAGLAEIKPHKAAAIRKGLQQLRDYLKGSEVVRRGNNPLSTAFPWAVPAREPERKSVWLITYLPWPANAEAPTHVRLFAHKLRREALLAEGKIPDLDHLTLSRRELPKIKLPKSIPFPPLTAPDMFGLAVEPLVRRGFAEVYQRPGTHQQRQGRKGADILWGELADLFRELADETGDAYFRELADELMA